MRIDGCCPCFQEIISWIAETSSSLLETIRDVGSWCFEQGRNLAGYFYVREPSAQDDKVQDIRESVIPSPTAPKEDEFDPQLEVVRRATEELKRVQEAEKMTPGRVKQDIGGLKANMFAAVRASKTQETWEIQLCRYTYGGKQPELHICCPQAVDQVIKEMSSHFDVTVGEIQICHDEGSGRITWKRSLQFSCKENPDSCVYGFGRDLKAAIARTVPQRSL